MVGKSLLDARGISDLHSPFGKFWHELDNIEEPPRRDGCRRSGSGSVSHDVATLADRVDEAVGVFR